jgi:hypothetical protein
MAQSLVVTPRWPNGSGASRSLGVPQSRIGVPGGHATTWHHSLQLVKPCKPPGFFRRWHTQSSRASRRSSRELRGRGARHGSRQAAAASAGGKRLVVILVDSSCHRRRFGCHLAGGAADAGVLIAVVVDVVAMTTIEELENPAAGAVQAAMQAAARAAVQAAALVAQAPSTMGDVETCRQSRRDFFEIGFDHGLRLWAP